MLKGKKLTFSYRRHPDSKTSTRPAWALKASSQGQTLLWPSPRDSATYLNGNVPTIVSLSGSGTAEIADLAVSSCPLSARFTYPHVSAKIRPSK